MFPQSSGAHGTLQPRTPPGELFAKFRPEPRDPLPEDAARRALALLQQLDSDGPKKPPTVLTVFRLYCIEEMTAAQIARNCHCSKATVIARMSTIRKKTGVSPKDLRRLSTHLSEIETDFLDPRAKDIYRKAPT
jgi:DNA-directed RNA polymerase specialized sigma24 family protein